MYQLQDTLVAHVDIIHLVHDDTPVTPQLDLSHQSEPVADNARNPLITVLLNQLQDTLLVNVDAIHHVQCSCSGWPTGYGKKVSSSQAQLGQATSLAVA